MRSSETEPETLVRDWQELVVPCPLAGEARALKRSLLRAGAVKVWQEPGRLRGVWPAEAVLPAGLGQREGVALRRFAARSPREAWENPPLDRIAPNLRLAPAWQGTGPGKRTLVIEALTAFGAGDHPSTRLNLMLLAGLSREGFSPPAGAWLADVGAGTGVLALAMGLLFQRPVAAVDPEPAAQRATLRNKSLNPLAGPWVHFVLGRSEVLAGPHPLVAANLPGPLLLGLFSDLAGLLAPGGRLTLSGFREEAAPELERAASAHGLELAASLGSLGWRGMMFRKPGRV